MKKTKKVPYFVYIMRCRDKSLYTGITNNIKRRLKEHNSSRNGARYTSARRPVRCVYKESQPDISSAMKRERQIKKLPRKKKQQLIRSKWATHPKI